jgi:predicted RNA-binding Zn-ribbon protein involved in translation (DUF1610 family)
MSDTIFAVVGDGFAIRASGHGGVIAIALCKSCGQSVSVSGATRDKTVSVDCPTCGNPIVMDFDTVCMHLSTAFPSENHDEEILIILREMREMGTEAWIDASIQT